MYAWQWVLGMDVPDVLPRLNNQELHNLETKVMAIIDVDGLEYSLCRKQTEEWKTNRETGQEEKQTNVSTYAIDGVEFTLKNYKDKLSQLFGVAYDKLEMLTNKDHFNTDKPPKWMWTARRKELFEITHADDLLRGLLQKSDYELIYQDLLKGFSATDIRKTKMKALKGIEGEKDRNVTLIEDKQADIQKYGAIDFAALEAQKAGYEAKITELNLTLIKGESGDKAQTKAKIDALIGERTQLQLADANELQRLKNALDSIELKKQFTVKQAGNLKAQLIDFENLERRIAEKRTLVWNGNETCPTCGQSLPAEKIAVAKAEWESAIASDIRLLKEQIAKGKEQNDEIDAQLYGLRATYKELESDGGLVFAEWDNFEYNPRIDAIFAEIEALKNQPNDTATNDTETVTALTDAKNRLTEIQSQLAYKQVVADLKARVEELKAKNRELTDMEMVLKAAIRAIDAYVAEQVSLITDSINALFEDGISFALFSEQYAGAESELKETCVCMLDGKVYTSLSTGERFKANLAVTTALQKAYGVCLPLFCDNAECFTGEIADAAERQIIALCASAGEELENCIQVQKEEV